MKVFAWRCMLSMLTLTNSLAPLSPLQKTLSTLAFHLAERIASLLRQILDHPTKVLYERLKGVPASILALSYLSKAIQHGISQPVKDGEVRRAASGLVKVLGMTARYARKGQERVNR